MITKKPQEGVWTLTAPDGREWKAESPLRCCGMENAERVPAEVAIERIIAATEDIWVEPTDEQILEAIQAKAMSERLAKDAKAILKLAKELNHG